MQTKSFNPLSRFNRIQEYSIHFLGGLFFYFIANVNPGYSESLPAYDRMNTIFITEFFNAIGENDYNLALTKLDRIHELPYNSTIYYDLVKTLKENIAIEDVENQLKQDEYAKALAHFEEVISDGGKSKRIMAEKSKVEGLIELNNYLSKGLNKDAEEAKKEYDILPKPEHISITSDLYKSWYLREKAIIDLGLKQEAIRLIHEIIDELDMTIITDSPRYSIVRDGLIQLLSTKSSSDEWEYLLSGNLDFSSLKDRGREEDGSKTYSQKRSIFLSEHQERLLEFSCYHLFQQENEETKNEIRGFFREKIPTTWTGKMLDTQLSFWEGHYFTGMVKLNELYENLTVFDGERIYRTGTEEYFKEAKQPIRPTLSGLFYHLHFIQSLP